MEQLLSLFDSFGSFWIVGNLLWHKQTQFAKIDSSKLISCEVVVGVRNVDLAELLKAKQSSSRTLTYKKKFLVE